MSNRFEDNPTAVYLEAISNAIKAGDMQAAADLTEKLATFDPEAAQALVDFVGVVKRITGEAGE